MGTHKKISRRLRLRKAKMEEEEDDDEKKIISP
jgi:hypothetical protein